MNYWAAARAWARDHTKQYTLWKAVPTVLSTFIGGWLFKLQTFPKALVIVATSITVYLLLYGGEFCWNLLIRAPLAITDSISAELETANTKIGNLEKEISRKSPIDTVKELEVKNWLAKFSEDEKKFLGWLLRQGETVDYRLRNCLLPQAAIDGALTKGRQSGLIKDRLDELRHPVTFINQNYADCLNNLLHTQ